MAAPDYEELKSGLSPQKAVKWITNQYLERFIKICQKNAPVEILNPSENQIPVKVTPSDTQGAELWVDPDDLPDTGGGDLAEYDVCRNGSATTRWLKEYPAPETEGGEE